MKLSEIIAEFKEIWGVLRWFMAKMRKYDWVVGVTVTVFVVVNAHLLCKAPSAFLCMVAWVYSVLSHLPYEIIQEVWTIPQGWLWSAYNLVPAVVMVMLIFVECRVTLAEFSKYRVFGCVIITMYMVVSWVAMFWFRYSVEILIARNYMFLPVLCIYVFIGIMCSILAKARQEDLKNRQKECKKKRSIKRNTRSNIKQALQPKRSVGCRLR